MISTHNISAANLIHANKGDPGRDRICRACLGQCASEHLFGNGEELIRRYRDCTSLHARAGDGLPEYVCRNCSNKMHEFYEFRQNCLNAYMVVLRELKYSAKVTSGQEHLSLSSNDTCNLRAPKVDFLEDTLSTDNFNEKGLQRYSPGIKKQNCNNVFVTKEKNHFHQKMFTCDDCKKTFKSRGWLIKHLQCHKQDNSEQTECNNEQESSIKNSKLKLVCPTCKRRFFKYTKFENHLRTHMGLPAAKLSCDRCGKLLKSEKSLRTHAQLHIENRKVYYCELCNKCFRQLASFKVHQQIHSGIKRSVCHICGLSIQQQNMKVHLLRHAKKKNYLCNTCNKSFVLSIELKMHELRHKKEKKFLCTHCRKSFFTKRELHRHLSSHSDRKPYACNMCDKSFKSDSYLVVHKRSHTGERPYQCEFCEQTFKRGKDLRNHRMRHTGERPYRCQYCDKAFIQKTPYNRHLQVHVENHASKHFDKTVANSDVGWFK